MGERSIGNSGRYAVTLALVLIWSMGSFATGCARLPYTTKTIHADERVVVTVQREVEARAYSHPVELSAADIADILRGFSVREQQRLPLRWFAEDAPPKPVFREDELQVLAPGLAEALQQLGSNERAHFEVRAPGFNPRESRDTTAGWVAVQGPYFYVTLEQFHRQVPIHNNDLYDINYPAVPPPPRDYILYFEPGRFWVEDQTGTRAVQYRRLLNLADVGGAGPRSVPPVGAP